MERICQYPKCAKVFIPHRTQLYCTVLCRQRWDHERYRERRNELNRRWKQAHPEAGRRHNMREHARDRKFLQVIKPQGLTMKQIKSLERALTQLAEQWSERNLRRSPGPINLRDRVTFQQ